MSHFSRITLNTAHPDVATALAGAGDSNAQREHHWLWRFFRGDPTARRDFLFRRMEPCGPYKHPSYYVVSERRPHQPHSAWCVETREYAPQLQQGERYAFELRVNPVVTRDGRRHDVVMDAKHALARQAGLEAWSQLPADQQAAITAQGYAFIHGQIVAWLGDHDGRPGFARRNGFSLATGNTADGPMLRADGYRRHRLSRKDCSGRQAWLTTIDLSGALIVEDAQRLRHALLNGIGHGKAWGCGLLLIRRP